MLDPTRSGDSRPRKAEEYGHRESPLPAPGESDHASDSAVGKAHDTGKDVPEVHSPHRPLRPDTVGPAHQQPTFLRGRANKATADKRPRCRALSRC
jgi:hypothetical protein